MKQLAGRAKNLHLQTVTECEKEGVKEDLQQVEVNITKVPFQRFTKDTDCRVAMMAEFFEIQAAVLLPLNAMVGL